MAKIAGEKRRGEGAERTEAVPRELKEEAARMVLDGHSVGLVCERLGLSGPTLLDQRKRSGGEWSGSATSPNSALTC